MRHARNEIPYSWFWLGKPIHKGYYRGERIRPVLVSDAFVESARSPRAEKPSCPRSGCELHKEQAQPATPSSSEAPNSNLDRKCCNCCLSQATPEPEIFQQHKRCSCESCSGSPTPSAPGPSRSGPNPTVRQSTGHIQEMSPRSHAVAASCDHIQDCPHSGSVRNDRQTEPARNRTLEVKCTCQANGPFPSPETSHHHHWCCPDDCHDTLLTTSVSDDSRSEFSVEPPSDRGYECRCGRLFLAFPVAPVGLEFAAE